MSESVIAAVDLGVTNAVAEVRPVQLRLYAPTPDGGGAWTCRVDLEGLYSRLAPAVGEDALQALCLALALAARALREIVAGGGRIEYAAGGEFPHEAYFGWLGPLRAPAT